MAKKKIGDELFPDEDDDSGILKTTSFIDKEKIPENQEIKEQIQSHLDGAISLLNRNLRNKQRAFDEIRKAVKLLDRL
jgi:hypothetical protein